MKHQVIKKSRKFRILFLCTGNSGRSQMAEAFARTFATSDLEIISAGEAHQDVSPFTLQVMAELGISIPTSISISVDEIRSERFDVVITLCNHANEICPIFPGSPARIHWSLIDPSKSNLSLTAEILYYFREIRDIISQRVSCLFQSGFLTSIRQLRLTLGSLLNNLTDGVMAHDLDRRIYFFNTAAQRITGYKYSEVIGRDCHQVFPGRFCGGDCSFCKDGEEAHSRIRYPRPFIRKNGVKLDLRMSVVTTQTPDDEVMGALVIFRDVTEIVKMREQIRDSRGWYGIIGQHPSMIKIFEAIRELADVNVPILIQGESGTGKEMVAKALHRLSSRSTNAFVPVNCGALPEGTLESELFGHVRGAFTGAIRDKKGRFELADGGTIFLDEIGEISLSMQVKLLRVLQEKSFVPVGGEKSLKVDVRVICASNKDLKLMTQRGEFREDLFYRLAVVPIYLPPLRERKSDIPLLINHFLDKHSEITGKVIHKIDPEVLDRMIKYNWPGNIRELSNAIQYALIKCHGGVVELEHLPPELTDGVVPRAVSKAGRKPKLTPELVRDVMLQTDANKAKAAKILGVSRTTLYRYLDELKVS